MLMTGAGALLGTAIGLALVWAGRLAFPDIPFRTPAWALVTAVGVALLTGLAFSWLPARRASLLQPVDALQKP
jgi:putative ABC transport system permease protein